MRKSKHGKPYCSKSCRMRHYNANILERTSNQRSKAEDILLSLLREAFPAMEILANCRTLVSNGLEVDLYVPAAKLAIELNGPVHYLPIYGEERLTKVRFKDAQKHAELHAMGIRLLVLDISRLQTRKRTEAFLKTQFVEAIQPLLMEARVGVPPTIG